MVKYEYLQITINVTTESFINELNSVGNLGWELVSAMSVPGTLNMTYVFKKIKDDKNKNILKD